MQETPPTSLSQLLADRGVPVLDLSHLGEGPAPRLAEIVTELRRSLGIEDGIAPSVGTVDLEAARRATVTLDHLAALGIIGATS